jgi:hypothetical protein
MQQVVDGRTPTKKIVQEFELSQPNVASIVRKNSAAGDYGEGSVMILAYFYKALLEQEKKEGK